MRNQPWHVFGADRFAAAISRALIERGERVILCAEDEGTRRDAGLFGIQAIHPDDVGEVARVLVTPACNRGHVAAILKTKPFPFTVEIKQERNPQDVRRIKPDIEWQVHGILDPLAPPRVEQVSEWVEGKVAWDVDDLVHAVATACSMSPIPETLQGGWRIAGADLQAMREGLSTGVQITQSSGPLANWWRHHRSGLNRIAGLDGMGPRAVWEAAMPDLQHHRRGTAVFAHGYKGYALWGCWPLMSQIWAQQQWRMQLIDFSMNGTVNCWPRDLCDSSAWSRNTYSAEVMELCSWVALHPKEEPLVLIGHSRGAVSTLAAGLDAERLGKQLVAVILLAPIAQLANRFPNGEDLERWRVEDRWEVRNARTGQVFTHPFRFYEDFLENGNNWDPLNTARQIQCPVIIYHAADDQAVVPQEGESLAAAAPQGEWHLLDAGGHVFGSQEPWSRADLPPELDQITRALLEDLSALPVRTWQ